ncbi:Succinate dehydrogenase cytochrome b560 subunit, mitochondrial [Hondaea fermentalgiana]|uniref:Succinate dehydrogenase cytochrome b560 subunit, mitochondrial n=1 Tax=Hondaea fermentalgiana TaxID=2315210 RepID=A0A2R5G3B6_9STRA|nr:Succinate dehydrogenase cytochrome b560 subunit, mitochondrial [Hondaea fermentalgiana]|eukprot:GBG25025.1 Succinate dehydrogenase cytochrome b560 subunit, mitochondrial [Hondaea fermentalgiana]
MLARQTPMVRGLAAACAGRNTLTAARKPLATQMTHVTDLSTSSKDERPVSPHILIYAWPLAAISSVTTRVTGGLLAVGVYGIGIGSLLGGDMPATMASLGASGLGPLVKLSVAFPLSYHFLGATRHFYWEKFPEGLNVDSQRMSSIGIFAGSGLISFILMFL